MNSIKFQTINFSIPLNFCPFLQMFVNFDELFFNFFYYSIIYIAGSHIIIVASKSTFYSDKNSSRLLTTDNGMLPALNSQNVQKNTEPSERTRRLIPFMTFYIPTTNADYVPYGPILNHMVMKLIGYL